jgi:hypothetical protein
MFGHIKSLKGQGMGDVHTGSSVDAAGTKYKSGNERGSGPSRSATSTTAKKKPLIKMGVQGNIRSVNTSSKSKGTSGPSFNKFKGVVNTIGGAKDTTRKQADTRLPSKGERKGGARIATLDTLPHANGEHVEANSDFVKRGSGGGGGAGTHVSAPGQGARKPLKQRRAEAAANATSKGTSHKLGGGSSAAPSTAASAAGSRAGSQPKPAGKAAAPTRATAANPAAAADARAKRAAYFEKLMADKAAAAPSS